MAIKPDLSKVSLKNIETLERYIDKCLSDKEWVQNNFKPTSTEKVYFIIDFPYGLHGSHGLDATIVAKYLEAGWGRVEVKHPTPEGKRSRSSVWLWE